MKHSGRILFASAVALLGLSSSTNALVVPEHEVKIGLASNFSEPSSSSSNPYGDYFRSGVNLALTDSAARLAKKGIHVKTVEFDYGTNQVRVLDAAKKAVASDVIGVIGYNFSSHTLLAAPIHQTAGLPMLTPSATADRLGRMGRFIHSACFDNSFMGETLAQVAQGRLKAKRAAIVVAADCAYCQDLANAFAKAFIAAGGKITARAEVLESDRDFSNAISQLKQMSYDVVLVPNQELNSARIISAILKAGINKPLLGGDGWGNVGDEFFSILGQQELQGYSVSHWHPDVISPRSKTFVSNYVKTFGKKPNDTSVLAYDATLLLVEALLRTKQYTRDGLEEALVGIRRFDGVTGEALFSNRGAPSKSLVLLSANKTRFKVLETIDPKGVRP